MSCSFSKSNFEVIKGVYIWATISRKLFIKMIFFWSFIFLSVAGFNDDLEAKHYSIVVSGVDQKIPARKYPFYTVVLCLNKP